MWEVADAAVVTTQWRQQKVKRFDADGCTRGNNIFKWEFMDPYDFGSIMWLYPSISLYREECVVWHGSVQME